MTNKNNFVLYVGMTHSLGKHSSEHYFKTYEGFTSRYNVNKLIYYEVYLDWRSAFQRERQIKRWSRVKKLRLIKNENPTVINLS